MQNFLIESKGYIKQFCDIILNTIPTILDHISSIYYVKLL